MSCSAKFLQDRLAVQDDCHIVLVVQVFNQRGVGQHGLQRPLFGVVAGFAPLPALEVPEELLQDIVGSLGMDGDRAGLLIKYCSRPRKQKL